MKKGLLLSLASILLPFSLANAQEPFVPPMPTPAPAPLREGPYIVPDIRTFEPSYAPMTPASRYRQEPRFWATGEFLFWYTKNSPVNTPLVTRALNPANPASGSIGSADTQIVLGNQELDQGLRYGGRMTLGGWFSPNGCWGMEASYLYITPRSHTARADSSGLPGSSELRLPFREAFTRDEVSVPLAGPNAFGPGVPGGGNASLRVGNSLHSGEANLIARLICKDSLTVIGIGGFRYFRLDEDLDFSGSFNIPLVNDGFTWQDRFHASNNFYGGQLGVRSDYCLGKWFVSGTLKCAVGTMSQQMEITGTNTFNTIPRDNGGFYALSSNIGTHSRNILAFIPEAEVKVGWNLTRNIQTFCGYNFMYVSNVARPGTGIDHTINVTQSPGFGGAPPFLFGPQSPSFGFGRTDFWAQGLTFGLQFKF